jgi:hypothetical protein
MNFALEKIGEHIIARQPYGKGWRVRTQKNTVSHSSLNTLLTQNDLSAKCAVGASSLDDVFHAVVGGTER